MKRCEPPCVQALPLVDAFNIPDHILRAPIGLSHQDPYDHYLERAGWTPAATPLIAPGTFLA